MTRNPALGHGVRPVMPTGTPTRRLGAVIVLALVTTEACSEAPTAVAPPGAVDLAAPWSVALPADVGLDAAALAGAVDAARAIERMRSFLVVRHGRLVVEEYFGGSDASVPADVRSVTKSLVGLLTGLAIERGHLRGLDQPIAEIVGPPDFPLTPAQRAITIAHLLTMTAGFEWSEGGVAGDDYGGWIRSEDPLGYLLDRPLAAAPGSAFAYNSAAVHLLGAVVADAVGRPLADWAEEVLFGPLGIGPVAWETLPDGRENGGSGIDLLPRDLARIGQLMLQAGWSGTTSVVPERWVEEARASRFAWTLEVGPLERVGYGYLWWIDVDHGAYFAWGFGGQFIYVAPGQELVVVATTEWLGAGVEGVAEELPGGVLDVIVNGVLEAVR